MDYFVCSEWVLGNREDLVKDITAELLLENGEVIFVEGFGICSGKIIELFFSSCVHDDSIMMYDAICN